MIHHRMRLMLLTAGVIAAVTIGCTARRGRPYTQPLALDDPQVARGQIAFMHHCHQCHPGGAGGLGPSINDKPLPAFLIRTQIRQGLGAMPAFDQQRLSDEDMNAIIAYLQDLRRTGPSLATR